MKSPPFSYSRPETLGAALALLADDTLDSAPLAGGQSLMPMMNFRVASPDRLIDLNRITGLSGVEDTGDTLRIGAMTRYAALAKDPLIAAHVPLFTAALPHIAHAAIRNRGTIGGSCALADPAAEMPALLIALDAELELQSTQGTRRVKADGFFVGLYETVLEEAELVTAIYVPKATAADRFGFHELTRRHGDYAMSGAAVAISGPNPITAARVVFFGVSDKATRATQAEAALIGRAPGDVPDLDLSEIDFDGDLNADAATKAHLSRVVLTRALQEMGA